MIELCIIAVGILVLLIAIFGSASRKNDQEYGEIVHEWRLVDYSLLISPVGVLNTSIPLSDIVECKVVKTCVCIETRAGDKYRLEAYLKQDAETKCNQINQRIKMCKENDVSSN